MQSETADLAPGAAIWRTQTKECCLTSSCRHLVNWIRVIFDSVPFAPLSENITSSTKLEIHNVFHCRQRRTVPCTQVLYTKKFNKIWTCGFYCVMLC